MAYKHGLTVSESPTSVLSSAAAYASLPVVVGTAPVNLGDVSNVNKPILAFSFAEAVKALGYSDDWSNFTLCEFIKSHFELYGASPAVLINVLDPAVHKETVTNESIPMNVGISTIQVEGILLPSLQVKLIENGDVLEKDTDYTAAFNDDGHIFVSAISGGKIGAGQNTIIVTYDKLKPTAITQAEIIGGVNGTTGAYTGLELINRVFPLLRLVPGLILAPGWSQNPTVAAIMIAKSSNINGLFKATAITDIDTSATGADVYSKAPAWKNTKNYTDPLQIACWPKVKLGDDVYHLSTQAAGVISLTDAANDDIPYFSPSNRAIKADSAVTATGDEVPLGPDQASYLNSQGIVTALNWVGGWKLWGSRTAAFPASADVKDNFIPVRRTFNWVGNQIILTYWDKVDNPTNKRLIDTVVDSINIWLNGLTAKGALLGGRVEFLKSENPVSDLINGKIRFHIFLTPPVPAEEIGFTLEFDVNYFDALFTA